MLKLNHITKTYSIDKIETKANQDISFTVNPGDMVWIRGRSGSGKTTLMNLITSIDKPDSGSIMFNEIDFLKLNDQQRSFLRRDEFGLMFQHFELLPMLNGYENIRVPFFFGRKGSVSQKNIDEITLKIRDDIDFLSKKVTRISGGQRQVINIVRALLNSPKLIIGDEITSNLDIELSQNVYALLRDTIAHNQSAGLFISHDPIIRDYCNRIFEMEDGILTEISVKPLSKGGVYHA